MLASSAVFLSRTLQGDDGNPARIDVESFEVLHEVPDTVVIELVFGDPMLRVKQSLVEMESVVTFETKGGEKMIAWSLPAGMPMVMGLVSFALVEEFFPARVAFTMSPYPSAVL